ncbi:hypothetical protein BH24DEI2_BH24DEI2_06910 [soil metagenome]
MRRAVSLFATVALLSACGSPHLAPPPAAPAQSYTGRYLGAAADNLGRADVELVLVQNSDMLTGEVLLTFRAGLARYTAAGDVTGSVTADGDVAITLTPDDPDYCPYRAKLTRAGAKLAGSYLGVGCVETIKGTLELEKQNVENQPLETQPAGTP